MASWYWCAAILFDLDGVLVHSDASIQRSWREWARRRGLSDETVTSAARGRRTVDTIRELAPHLEPGREAAALEAAQARDSSDVIAGQGAAGLIGNLREKEWAVVTSGTRALARARLSAANLPEPEVLICGDDVTRGKPHPDAPRKRPRLLTSLPWTKNPRLTASSHAALDCLGQNVRLA